MNDHFLELVIANGLGESAMLCRYCCAQLATGAGTVGEMSVDISTPERGLPSHPTFYGTVRYFPRTPVNGARRRWAEAARDPDPLTVAF